MRAFAEKSHRRAEPRLFARHKQLLALLSALGGPVCNLDFQKLLLLYCKELGEAGLYEFVPYRYGAFSFTSYADRRKLVAYGLLAPEESHWSLTAKSRRRVGRNQDLRISYFATRYRDLRGDRLVAETYRRFPYYAIRSEIADRVLDRDDVALQRIKLARPRPDENTLFTIGYEGRSIEGYLNALVRAGVTLLCDVRRNAISRKYGFSKSVLSNVCEKLDVGYKHLPELGITSKKRWNLETQADYDALFREYERTTLPRQREALSKIQAWIRSGERVALTCFERLSQQCHRRCVAKALELEAGPRFTSNHL